ncbi:hydroxysqualene dehydroxylase HpnE [Enhydrobacter aerosaccus]|nr:hydroxysqualene dehydroxylase HpnE [Enhydrobacter aerosaccus]
MAEPPRIHIVGAGLAGLSAAVVLADRGLRVVLSEAAKQAGGRCRSYHDSVLDTVIDNGNHLVLSGNVAVTRYLRAIGAADRLTGPDHPIFPFFDLGTGRRWVLRPNDGPIPWWILDSHRRVPGTNPLEYLAFATLMRRHPGRRIDEVLSCRGPLWDMFLKQLLVSALNTDPKEGSADLAGAVVRETLARGGHATRPLVATPSLAAAFVDPALMHLGRQGAEIRFGRPLRAITLAEDRVAALHFDDGEQQVDAAEQVILAVPPWTAQSLLPDVKTPSAFNAIVNGHFRIAPPPRAASLTGLVGGTAEWVFAFHDRLSVTVSAADRLLDMDTDRLASLLWADVAAVHDLQGPVPPTRIVKEKRATFAATPAQEARRPAAATRWHNLFLAGDWTATGLPATIEGALRSGEVAASLATGSGTTR